ncbi:MAG TPA: hypothetical protein PLP19_14035 [bacterium]|nr:hypothetical protein [bacterium]HPN44608.1 hypothetical protein [bacterium]
MLDFTKQTRSSSSPPRLAGLTYRDDISWLVHYDRSGVHTSVRKMFQGFTPWNKGLLPIIICRTTCPALTCGMGSIPMPSYDQDKTG